MKKSLLFLLAFIVVSLVSLDILAQGNSFAAKKRTALPGRSAYPANVLPVSQNTSSTPNRTAGITSYTPSRVNPGSLTLSQVFKESRFNEKGQLIFLDGALPGASPVNIYSRASVEDACVEYLDAIRAALQINSPGEEFRLVTVTSDELGMNHMRMQQEYKGIPVWCSDIYLHSREGYIDLFNGACYPTPDLQNVTPFISGRDAANIAVSDIRNRTSYVDLNSDEKELLGYEQPLSELVIYHKDMKTDQPELTWHVSIRPNVIEIWEYFVDATTGEVIHYYNNTRCDGDVSASGQDLNGVNRNVHAYLENGTYYLVDISRPMFNSETFDGVLSVYDAQNTNPGQPDFTASIVTSGNNSWSPSAISAMYNAQVTYEYFRTVHNRNSYNNQGGALKAIIHVADENGSGFDNAFWNGIAVFYGDGFQQFKPLAGGLDVGAHEYGHAFEGSASNLEYQGQSGAIAESYADFSGAMVERQNWTIGEQVVKTSFYPTGCLRNMADPHNGGSGLNDAGWQPSNTSEMYNGTEDNGGVHINSGIPNNAFYRAATAIGNEKTEKIFWRACFNYNTRSSQFIDLRLNTIQAAKDLYGENSAEKTAIENAFDAVGITNGQGGNYETELQVNPGQDYILFLDTYTGDSYTLYISSISGTEFLPLSETEVSNKPSIVDNGSYALFISGDSKMRSITLGDTPSETIIQNDPMWHNVAAAKDGTKLSAITVYQDSSIWVYSYQKQEWATFHLYNSTTAQGEETNTVIYADVMEWDYSGEYVMYDALSRIENPNGDPIEYWDINFIKVWDNASNDWATGEIYKIFGNLPAGISVGNPSFAKNSPFIFGFDLLDAADNSVTVGAANFETGDMGQVFTNAGILGTPNYSKFDNQMIFTVPDGSDESIAIIDMAADKINPASSNANILIPQAKWGLWFSQGSRPLLSVPSHETEYEAELYPNPTSGDVKLTLDPAPEQDILIRIMDLSGRCVMTYTSPAQPQVTINLEEIPTGMYLVNISSGNMLINKKVMVR
jgi:Zn-dependent metalloprotease